eukprot:CAMPEP_0118861580 /NCGR_PEP_ID=MMETSP1163-20130328/7070_1 /TAXON_ID=124430 /ORGANISM="Phaeomonas parva, Strain CCMP2877" /LENGTH=182 /DNA_ID=CAMNT_0006795407 /DNA_START=263 /DNA_END=807 /DNA_ORIENTATION=-
MANFAAEAVAAHAEDYGNLGRLEVAMYSGEEFIQATRSGQEEDHTGKRPYGGAMVFCDALGGSAALRSLLGGGSRVAELGCGVGLVGLALARCRAAALVLTDGEASTVDLARRNVEAAGVGTGTEVRCMRLGWGSAEELAAVQGTQPSGGFDVVLGTDLMYYRTDVPELVNCAAGLLLGAGG